MPGIAGIVSRKPADECRRLIDGMIRSMRHERFYESGVCCEPELGLYAGWTAHEGSFAARQNAAARQVAIPVLLSGEYFGAASSRDDRNAAAHEPCTSDIELAYEKSGDDFVAGLNGLFAGVLIDRSRKRALLFNDRYSAERIYVHETEDATYFASEAKALLQVLPELRAFDVAGITQFLTYGCTVDSRTIFQGIRLLEGGSLWSFQRGERRKRRYFVPEQWEQQPKLSAPAFAAEFKNTFHRVLPRYIGQGIDTGISLTGGLDTRMIMACLPPLNDVCREPVCYTFSGLTEDTLDQRLAARVAAACHLPHHILRIGRDFLSDYGRHVDRAVYVTDGCCGAMGAHEIYLNAKARQLAQVRVTGNFGSEVLRSMSTFKPMQLSDGLFHRDFAPLMARSAQQPPRTSEHPVTFATFREIPWNLFGTMAAGKSQLTFRTPYLDNEIVSLAFRAPDVSRQSSDFAERVVNESHATLGRIPTDRGLLGEAGGLRQASRRLFSEVTFKLDYLYQEGLPHRLSRLDAVSGRLVQMGLLGLHKYLPFRHWYRRDLSGYVAGVLTDPRTSRLPFWNAAFLESIARDHIAGRRNYVREINAVLTLEAVDRLFVAGATGRAS